MKSKNIETQIGITHSKLCKTMIKSNYTSTCPTYNQLISYDTSNQKISGKFVTDADGYFHREPTPYYQSFRYYDNDPTSRIFVDPPDETANKIKMIEIISNFDSYILDTIHYEKSVFDFIEVTYNGKTYQKAIGNQNKNQTTHLNNTISDFGHIIYHDRYIEKCNNATITADRWEELLPLTISFLKNNCNEDNRQFQEKKFNKYNKTEIDISKTKMWEDRMRHQWILDNCLTTYGTCNPPRLITK